MTSPSSNGREPEHVSGEVVTDDDLDPWERRESESPEAFEAFRAFLDLGAQRSYRKAARVIGKDASLCGRWSSTHAWQARSIEWDRFQHRRNIEAQHEARLAMAHRHAEAASTMHEIAYRGARAILRKIVIAEREAGKRFPNDPERAADLAAILFPLDEDTILKYASLGQQLERQALGEPDLRAEVAAGTAGVTSTLDPIARAIVTDPSVRDAARELVERAARARASIASRSSAGDQ